MFCTFRRMKRGTMALLLTMLALFGDLPGDAGIAAGMRQPPVQERSSLSAWARSKGFAMKLQGDVISLSKGSTLVTLQNDSREARINGVQVWLLYPVSRRGGMIQLANLDLRSTLEPILFPTANRPSPPVHTICLDPGHGGKDSGSQVGFRLEKRYTLLLAQELRDQLVDAGFRVVLTRTTDTFVDLSDRPALAKRRGADLFLSLHYNATDTGAKEVRGAEVYSLTPPGAPSTNVQGQGGDSGRFSGNSFDGLNMFLAYQIQRAIVRDLDVVDRGVHRARFVVLRESTIPAALIEPGFLSHPVEGKKLFESSYRRDIAIAITRAVVAYRKTIQQGA